MREYFLGLILFAFFGSVILSVAPQGLGRKYLGFLCGLCSVGCIIFPLASLTYDGGAESVKAIFEVSDKYEENAVEIYNLYLDEAVIKNAEENLKSEIISEMGADYEDLDVDIILEKNSDDFYIKCASVTLYPSGYDLDPRGIEKICFSRLECACEFFYDV